MQYLSRVSLTLIVKVTHRERYTVLDILTCTSFICQFCSLERSDIVECKWKIIGILVFITNVDCVPFQRETTLVSLKGSVVLPYDKLTPPVNVYLWMNGDMISESPKMRDVHVKWLVINFCWNYMRNFYSKHLDVQLCRWNFLIGKSNIQFFACCSCIWVI